MQKIITFQEHIKSLKITKEDFEDKLWRVENLYPIRNKQGMLIPFKLNIHQKQIAYRLVNNILNNDYSPLVILKARQLGISTFFAIWFLDDVLNYQGRRAVIQSQKRETMGDIFAICLTACRFMKDVKGIKKELKEKQGKISLPRFGSFIESKLEVRSMSVNMMHYSEYSFMDRDRVMATTGSLSNECIKVIESTPNGLNHFYDLYKEQKNKYPKNVFFFPWYKHYEYKLPVPPEGLGKLTAEEIDLKEHYNLNDEQITWMRKRQDEMKFLDEIHQTFNQEYPFNDEECFLLSGSGLIHPLILRDMYNQCKKANPKVIWDGELKIKLFKVPDLKETKKQSFYQLYCGVDPAEGVGGDYSVAIIIGIDSQLKTEVLMTMRGNEGPTLLAPKIMKYIQKYFTYSIDGESVTPYMVVERNNHGHALLTLLIPRYENLYVHTKDRRYGFFTTHISKRMILGNMFNLINSRDIELNDPIIANELRTLVKTDSNKIQADEGKKDDCVMALALAYQGYFSLNENYGHAELEEELRQKALDKLKKPNNNELQSKELNKVPTQQDLINNAMHNPIKPTGDIAHIDYLDY